MAILASAFLGSALLKADDSRPPAQLPDKSPSQGMQVGVAELWR